MAFNIAEVAGKAVNAGRDYREDIYCMTLNIDVLLSFAAGLRWCTKFQKVGNDTPINEIVKIFLCESWTPVFLCLIGRLLNSEPCAL